MPLVRLTLTARSAGIWAAGRNRAMMQNHIPEKADAFQSLVGLVYPAPLDRPGHVGAPSH
jgi:hypothetical protein